MTDGLEKTIRELKITIILFGAVLVAGFAILIVMTNNLDGQIGSLSAKIAEDFGINRLVQTPPDVK